MGFDKSFTNYLFAKPSFLEGVARTLDIGGTFDFYNESPNGRIADTRAIMNDWKMVGLDIQEGINAYRKEITGGETLERKNTVYARTT